MDKKVTVLTPNGRRQNVKVTPNTTLLQVLEEVCKKYPEFASDEHCLKHHNKEIDLAQMFRFSGLPNNCMLEMYPTETKRVASNVDICVQLEDGSRTQGTFLPSSTLWSVLCELCADASSSYENPVVIYTRQEIIGREKLMETTLKSLGILEGRTLMRFVNKKLEDLKTQANVYLAPTVKETPKEDSAAGGNRPNARSGGGGGFALTKDLLKSLKKPSPSADEAQPTENRSEEAQPKQEEIQPEKPKYDWGSGTGRSIKGSEMHLDPDAGSNDDQNVENEPEINIIGEREAILYSLNNTQRQVNDLPDSFFDLTLHDLKLVLRDLRKISRGDTEAPLLTEKLRELEENKTMLNKIAKYKNCVIRVKFPDGYVLQAMFKPIEKISHVVEFVRTFLQTPDLPFHLFTTPPKVQPDLDKTLLELDFVPTAMLYFSYNDDIAEPTYMKEEFVEKLTSLEGALHAASKFRIASAKSYAGDKNCNDDDDDDFLMGFSTEQPGASTGAIPKRRRN